jgi:hypothetical protein
VGSWVFLAIALELAISSLHITSSIYGGARLDVTRGLWISWVSSEDKIPAVLVDPLAWRASRPTRESATGGASHFVVGSRKCVGWSSPQPWISAAENTPPSKSAKTGAASVWQCRHKGQASPLPACRATADKSLGVLLADAPASEAYCPILDEDNSTRKTTGCDFAWRTRIHTSSFRKKEDTADV